MSRGGCHWDSSSSPHNIKVHESTACRRSPTHQPAGVDYDSPKVRYVVEDVIRHAKAYRLPMRPGPCVATAQET